MGKVLGKASYGGVLKLLFNGIHNEAFWHIPILAFHKGKPGRISLNPMSQFSFLVQQLQLVWFQCNRMTSARPTKNSLWETWFQELVPLVHWFFTYAYEHRTQSAIVISLILWRLCKIFVMESTLGSSWYWVSIARYFSAHCPFFFLSFPCCSVYHRGLGEHSCVQTGNKSLW